MEIYSNLSFATRDREDVATDAVIVGRDEEQRILRRFLNSPSGGALVLRGAPGCGKSALLGEMARLAAGSHRRVIRERALLSEGGLDSGLEMLMQPEQSNGWRGNSGGLVSSRFVISSTSVVGPDHPAVRHATLPSPTEPDVRRPVVWLVDNADRLNYSTQQLVARVARFATVARVVMVLTVGQGYASPLVEPGLTVHELTPLDEAAAGRLITCRAAGLDASTRRRILAQAAGNPLAIVELAKAQHAHGLEVFGDAPLLTRRLREAFARSVDALPYRTRILLLVAAVNDSDSLQEALAATDLLEGSPATLDDLGPATAAGIVDTDAWSIRFRHTLTAPAIAQSASPELRRAVHGSLATVLASHPDRMTWHAAGAASRPDDRAARALESVAVRADERRRPAAAAAIWERAASLTENPIVRAQRLLRAAALWREVERPEIARRLLAYTRGLDLPCVDHARATWLRHRDELLGAAGRGSLDPVLTLAEELNRGGDAEMAIQALNAVARQLWSTGAGPEKRRRVLVAARRIAVRSDHPRLLSTVAFLGVPDAEPPSLESLAVADPTGLRAPDDACRIALAALLAGHVTRGGPPFDDPVLAELRASPRRTLLIRALHVQAYHGLIAGRWDVAAVAAEEVIRLAAADSRPLDGAAARGVLALLAALRGDRNKVEVLTDEIDRTSIPLGAAPLVAIARAARGLLALGDGDGDGATAHFDCIIDPEDPSNDPAVGQWVLADAVEARLRVGEPEGAAALLAAFDARIPPARAVLLPSLVRARTLLAPDDRRDTECRCAIDLRLREVPFMRAQTLLDYGSWLRRQRRRAESRAPLRAAGDVFRALGATPWAGRAEQELRASGQTSRRRIPDARDQLSPQELQIARMAADGLTNRAIGERLYLSNRTVGSHLYRIFPKLGICSRAELAAALEYAEPCASCCGGD